MASYCFIGMDIKEEKDYDIFFRHPCPQIENFLAEHGYPVDCDFVDDVFREALKAHDLFSGWEAEKVGEILSNPHITFYHQQ